MIRLIEQLGSIRKSIGYEGCCILGLFQGLALRIAMAERAIDRHDVTKRVVGAVCISVFRIVVGPVPGNFDSFR